MTLADQLEQLRRQLSLRCPDSPGRIYTPLPGDPDRCRCGKLRQHH